MKDLILRCGCNFSEVESASYVFHPINAYHLIKRMAEWLPKIEIYGVNNMTHDFKSKNLENDYR